MRTLFILLFFIVNAMSASTIKLAVAANVSYAMNDLIKAFESKHPNIKVKVTLGSSGKLTAQIAHGAPYDLFMSANMKYPQSLYQKGLTQDEPEVYAKGVLALLSTKRLELFKGLDALNDSSIKRIAIANPKTAPYGVAAFEALRNSRQLETLKSRFIYGESVAQTLAYTISAADVGIIAASSLYSSKLTHLKKNQDWVLIPSTLYSPIKQGMVILSKSKNKTQAKAFYEFMKSHHAKETLQSYGYLVEASK